MRSPPVLRRGTRGEQMAVTKFALVNRPGRCRWCGCTYDHACANGCSWVDRTQTLCSECWPLDEAMKTAKGRRALVLFLQEHWPDPISAARRR